MTGYIALIGRPNRASPISGPDRAAYAHVAAPVVALAVSTVFEGYQWTALAAAGIGLALGGNIIVLRRPDRSPVQADGGLR